MYGTVHSEVADGPGVVVVTASTGGLAALTTVLSALPAHFSSPVLVVLHRAVVEPDPLPRILAARCARPVAPVTDSARLDPGLVSVVPADRQPRFGPDGVLHLTALGPGRRPTADRVLVDAAACFGPAVLAVVLTGRLCDGAEGVRAVRAAGGMVLVQDPADCAAPGMPTAALATGCVQHRLPLRVIGPALVTLTMVPGAAELFRVPLAPWASLEVSADAHLDAAAEGWAETAVEAPDPATAA